MWLGTQIRLVKFVSDEETFMGDPQPSYGCCFPCSFPFLLFFFVDTDVDADVDAAGCQGALMGSRGETKHHLPMEEKWKQEDPDTRE